MEFDGDSGVCCWIDRGIHFKLFYQVNTSFLLLDTKESKERFINHYKYFKKEIKYKIKSIQNGLVLKAEDKITEKNPTLLLIFLQSIASS